MLSGRMGLTLVVEYIMGVRFGRDFENNFE